MHYGVVSGTGNHDLTAWLGDGCTVRTSKSIRSPMGQFTITFVDKEYREDFADSVYYLFAPMDAVEIRVAHDGRKTPKLIMRGFVSDVRRDESIGQDGKPVRRVTVIGHDVGKLLVQHRIYMLPTPEEVGMAMTAWGPLIKYFGPSDKDMSVAEYVEKMTGILQAHLDALLATSVLSGLFLFPRPSAEGLIPPLILNNLNDVSYHDHMSKILDVGSFNELFTRDDETGADVIVRPVFTDDPGITITEQEVQSVSTHRTDADVANWFWARISRAQNYDQATALIQAMETGNYDLRTFDPCHKNKYGFRKLEVDVSLFPPGHGLQDTPYLEQVHANQEVLYPWLTNRQGMLVANNAYNALFESGAFRIEGNENATHGTWLTFNKGATTQRHYITQVDHDFQVLGNYVTTLQTERGDSYMQRMAGGGYRPELNLKGALK
jgi:hypothetical protein